MKLRDVVRQMSRLLICCLSISCGDSPKPNGIIALLTDYGTTDAYVGAVSGAILRVNPRARLVTITHQVPSYDIQEASYLLASAAGEFPVGTVFMAVVDPGVGSSRRPIVIETLDGKFFVGPDNGVFSDVIRAVGFKRVHAIDNVLWIRAGSISTTFHGRDIFGPAAARLSLGSRVEEAGALIEKPEQFSRPEPRLDGTTLSGQILHRDYYGNLISNIPAEMAAKAGLKNGMKMMLSTANTSVLASFESRYSAVDSGAFVAVINSQGRMEIARNLASAGDSLHAKSGDALQLSTRVLE